MGYVAAAKGGGPNLRTDSPDSGEQQSEAKASHSQFWNEMPASLSK